MRVNVTDIMLQLVNGRYNFKSPCLCGFNVTDIMLQLVNDRYNFKSPRLCGFNVTDIMLQLDRHRHGTSYERLQEAVLRCGSVGYWVDIAMGLKEIRLTSP